MALTNAGRDFLAGAAVGQRTPVFDSANAFLAVGDSAATFDATQINLQGTNQQRKGMDAGYPTYTGNTTTFQSTYQATEANFPWNEWGVLNAAIGGTLLNRFVEYNGTKQAGQTWIFQVAISIKLGV